MSYFAGAAVRGSKGWTTAELDLSTAADLEEVAELLRDLDVEADVSLLFVEADETYLVIVRLDEGEELRIFGSDAVFGDESRLGALLLGEIEEPALELDDVTEEPDDADEEDEEPAAADLDMEPVGDPDLLADLGVPGKRLLDLCARDGVLPSDITAEICQTIGCGDEMEELREV